jgi:hypothetical protein
MGRVPAVRAGVTTILLTLGLSLVIWVFFYIATPGAPLTARHITVIAGLSFGAVLASSARRSSEISQIPGTAVTMPGSTFTRPTVQATPSPGFATAEARDDKP